MRGLSLLVLCGVALFVSCGAAPDDRDGDFVREAEVGWGERQPDDEASPFVVFGDRAEHDVRVEADGVVMETGSVRMRWIDATSRWVREEREEPRVEAAASEPFVPSGVELVGEVYERVTRPRPDGSGWMVSHAKLGEDDWAFSAIRWSASGEGRAMKLPMASKPYATFPVEIIARADDDVWVFASTTSDHFGPNFPGCPISIRMGQDGGYVAHFDGRAWSEIAYPGKLHIDDVREDASGRFVVSTGWSEDAQAMVDEKGQQTWLLDPSTRTWTAVPDPNATRSSSRGWKIEGDRLLHEVAGAWEQVELPKTEGEPARVPARVVAVTEEDVFVLAAAWPGPSVWYRTR